MNDTLTDLLSCLHSSEISEAGVIPWSSPVPSFGDLRSSRVATLGLNPSNREFVDEDGNELEGESRRFHTLKSLGLSSWANVRQRHLDLIESSCNQYFYNNPYDGWFKRLDVLLSGTSTSFYSDSEQACHLDLIPFATASKWTNLTRHQRSLLMILSQNILAKLLKSSPIELLILNGNSVVMHFQEMSGTILEKTQMPQWALPRKTLSDVSGFSYKGKIQTLSGIQFDREITVLGYNHNIQSSFGVTRQVIQSIRDWIALNAKEVLA